MTRRIFLSFFIAGGLVTFFRRKLPVNKKTKEAMFWRKV
jgi:hypothetical protein